MAIGDNSNEVYDSSTLCLSGDNDMDDLSNELYDSLIKVKKELNHNSTKLCL